MISCLLIHVSRNPQGLPICKDSAIIGTSIQIGRGAACKIHLLDHRVNLLHANIARAEDGTLHINAERDATLKIDGYIAQSAPLVPGTHIEIGPYELTVEPTAIGHDIILSVELIHPLALHDTETNRAPITLTALGLSKRRLGFGLAAIILLLFLILPMLPSTSALLDKGQSSLPATLNGSWSPGPLAGGHALFENKCSTCHQTPFQAVSDKVCTNCHKQVGHHVSKEDIQEKSFKGMRCTNCHIDHKGNERLVLHDSAKCVSCHGDIKQKIDATELSNVRDFASVHPQFHITIQKDKTAIRVRLDDKARLAEQSGLKYSHQVHLAKEGISTPEGDTVMKCQDCHKLEDSGRHFSAMTMQKSCQQSGCHSLDFTDPVEGVAPHGSEHAVMDRLREFFAKWLSDTPENRAECTNKTGIEGLLSCADELAQKNAAATLFRTVPTSKKDRLECGECHQIEPTGESEVPWKITPVRINRDWQPGASFSHGKHEAMNCTDCHDKTNSKVSADIAMPKIEKCRECHVGSKPRKGMVTSGCDSCHRFHQAVK